MKSFLNDQYIKTKSVLDIGYREDKPFSLIISNDCSNTSDKWDLESFRPDIPYTTKNKDSIIFYENIKSTGNRYLIPRYIYIDDKCYINIR